MKTRFAFACLMLIPTLSYANDVSILGAAIYHQSQNTYFVNVKLQHQDTGWDHYADEWRLVDEKGTVVARRVLMHPHVEEQPFARGQGNIQIDDDIATLYIEAHDTVHGWSPDRLKVDLTKMQGGKLFITAP